MSAKSPGSRVSHPEASLLDIRPLHHSDIIGSLTALCDIFSASYGPKGLGILVHNNCGGNANLTTSTLRILKTLSVNKPVIKLVTSGLQNHCETFSDGDTFVAVFCLQLILKALASDVNKRFITEVYDILLQEFLDFLNSSLCSVKVHISFENTTRLVLLIRSLYMSKPCCLLFEDDLTHLSLLTLESFVKTIACSLNDGKAGSLQLCYVTCEGKPAQESKLFTGLLVQTPQIPIFLRQTLKVKRNNGGLITVALVEVSLAGDSETFLDTNYKLSSNLKHEDAVLHQLISFCERLLHAEVGVLACQKVVHPTVKKFLKKESVLVLERLGRIDFANLKILAGGSVLNPFDTGSVKSSSFLTAVEHKVCLNKSFVHLSGIQENVCTVMLCQRTAESLNEVKHVFQLAQHLLKQVTGRPELLCGGSCWITCLAYHLRTKVPFLVNEHKDSFGVSEAQLERVLHLGISALEYPALTLGGPDKTSQLVDRRTGHHFTGVDFTEETTIQCMCGSVTYSSVSEMEYYILSDPEKSFNPTQASLDNVSDNRGDSNFERCKVFDVFNVAVGSLKTAIGLANMILSIRNFVQDVK